jgi:hypothetical protein
LRVVHLAQLPTARVVERTLHGPPEGDDTKCRVPSPPSSPSERAGLAAAAERHGEERDGGGTPAGSSLGHRRRAVSPPSSHEPSYPIAEGTKKGALGFHEDLVRRCEALFCP